MRRKKRINEIKKTGSRAARLGCESLASGKNPLSHKRINYELLALGGVVGLTILTGAILMSGEVLADDSVVDQINITVPVSCTMSGTGMNTHNAEIQNGTYTPNIGTTTLHAFCNDA